MKNNEFVKVYIYIDSDSPGLIQDAIIYSTYIKNAQMLSNLKDITEKDYYLLFLERINPINIKYLINSKKNIFMVNIDLFISDSPYLKYINLFLCKTKYTEECLRELINKQILKKTNLLYTNHTSIPDNLFNPAIKKNYKYFLHSAGKSPFKNTYQIIKTWLNYKLPPIIITCYKSCLGLLVKQLNNDRIKFNLEELKKNNIIFYSDKLNNEKIIYYKNYCGIHICPSKKEGYGHYLNEARIVKAVIITIDGKPMNEFVKNELNGYLIPCKVIEKSKWNLSLKYDFNPVDLYNIITKILKTDIKTLEKMGEMGFNMYLSDSEYFINNINNIYK